MHILIAPNAFKNSLSAEDAATAIGEGLKQSKLNCTFEHFPVADGGDGTADLITKKCNGVLIDSEVHNPIHGIIKSRFSLIDGGKTAVIEMADASGLRLLQPYELDPIHASSFGTGELIMHAINMGANKILLAMGGSATVDGGAGILKALGVRFLNAKNGEIEALPANMVDLASIDMQSLNERVLNCEIVVLCDVDNVLLGTNRAAAIFGPQKGASPVDVENLEMALTRFATIATSLTGRDMAAIKHGGTAGGAAAGLYAILNAKLVNGIDYFLDLTGIDIALQNANLVITGEGSIDEQTLQGKGPYGVACRAKCKGIPVIALAGKVPLITNLSLQRYFDALVPIGHQPEDLNDALKHTAENLVRTSKALGDLLAIGHAISTRS
jgi:glycerate kinase